jgi:hypothetical protein
MRRNRITERDLSRIIRRVLSEDGVIIKAKEGKNILNSLTDDYTSVSINNLKIIESFITQNNSKSESLNCEKSITTNESYNINEGVKIKPKPENCEPGVCDSGTVAQRMEKFYDELQRLSDEANYLMPFIEKTDWCDNRNL